MKNSTSLEGAGVSQAGLLLIELPPGIVVLKVAIGTTVSPSIVWRN